MSMGNVSLCSLMMSISALTSRMSTNFSSSLCVPIVIAELMLSRILASRVAKVAKTNRVPSPASGGHPAGSGFGIGDAWCPGVCKTCRMSGSPVTYGVCGVGGGGGAFGSYRARVGCCGDARSMAGPCESNGPSLFTADFMSAGWLCVLCVCSCGASACVWVWLCAVG